MAEPFTNLRVQKIFKLMQDPFRARRHHVEHVLGRWFLNHVGSVYGMMDEVFTFAATFKEFPLRSFPPTFNLATIMEALEDLKAARRRAASEQGR